MPGVKTLAQVLRILQAAVHILLCVLLFGQYMHALELIGLLFWSAKATAHVLYWQLCLAVAPELLSVLLFDGMQL